MALNRATITPVDDDGSGGTGTEMDAAWWASVYDQIDAALGSISAAAITSGTLPVARGGTGVATLTDKGIVYGNGTSAVGVTAVGTAGQVLTSNGAGVAPTFQTVAGGGTFTEQTTSNTGNQNNFNLGAHLTFLRCTGAAPVFSGFTVLGAAPAAGDCVVIQCIGTTAKVTNEDTNSTAANRIISPSTNGQIVGVNGQMILRYDDTTDRWREALIDPGAYISVAYSAGDYTASGAMTWTVDAGDVKVYQYRQRGNVLDIEFNVETSTVGGTANNGLRAALPSGFTSKSNFRYQMCYAFQNSTNSVAFMVTNATTYMEWQLLVGPNWTLGTNAVYVAGNFTVQVN